MSLVVSLLALAGTSIALPSVIRRSGPVGSGIISDPSAVAGQQFDYVIAGGGLTGLTVASKLTEDPSINVLVIEGGQDNHEDPLVYDVRTYGQAFGTSLDYNLTSTPVQWQNGKQLAMVAGHTLGGSGSINGASWTKGPSSQYDQWAMLSGDPSWGWQSFNEYMLKCENFSPPGPDLQAKGANYTPAYHGEGGPVQVAFAAGLFGKFQLEALEASKNVYPGLGYVDASSGAANGATTIPNMVDPTPEQNRSSPFTAYAEKEVQERPNFTILVGHRVIRINWSDDESASSYGSYEASDDLVATGVTFQACPDCPTYFAGASREVLLATGSLQSPQLLELSGVGDPNVLISAGVPLRKKAMAVGKNMQEQTKTSLFYTLKNPEFDGSGVPDFDGSGPSTAVAFPNIQQILGEANATKAIQMALDGLPAYTQQLQAQGSIVDAAATQQILTAQLNNLLHDNVPAAEVFYTLSTETGLVGADLWNLIVMSRGTVHIQSNSSWDQPAIDPRYFANPLDETLQTFATIRTRDVFNSSPLQEIIGEEEEPGPAIPAGSDPAVWEAWIKSTFTSVWHYLATLAMMKEELGGAVSNELKVYGLKNVRAIDASVMPLQLSAHLSATLYGIALKAADMIKADQ